MKHTLTITFPEGFTPRVYPSAQEARAAAAVVDYLSDYVLRYTITPVLDSLNGWMPDEAEQMLMRALLGMGNKVGPIRFARMRASCGLKEAKDWIDTQMADAYVAPPVR